MRLTSEYVSEDKSVDSDDESKKSTTSESFKRRGMRVKKLFSEIKSKAIVKAKSLTAKSSSEDVPGSEADAPEDTTGLKIKASPKHKGPYDFENLQLVQDLGSGVHSGPIWCMKFSNCGRLLATAGQDRLIRIWVLKSQLAYFQDLIKASKVSPTPSLESVPGPGSDDKSE
jgi:WD40 repeat protein